MLRVALLVAAVVGLPWLGCGSSGGSTDVHFVPDDILPDQNSGDAAQDAVRPPTQVTEPFRIVFPYLKYSLPAQLDLAWTDPMAPTWDPDVSFSGLVLQRDAALSCELGCFPARSGQWIAVVVSGPTSDTTGNVIRLFRLADGPLLEESGIPDVTDVTTFAFGSDSFVFTRALADCVPSAIEKKSCVKFFRIDLSVPNPMGEEFLFTFPTADRIEEALPHSGRFTMGQDGRSIVVLSRTPGSQTAWLWRGSAGDPILVAGPICAGPAPGGGCLETEGGFTDADPVALSADGNHLVLAVVEDDRSLVLTHVDIRDVVAGAEPRRTTVSLLAMPQGISYKNRCYNRQTWQPTFVLSPMKFTPDGSELVFAAGTDCPPNKFKPWSNVLAIQMSRLESNGALANQDLRWITDFPQGDSAANVSIPIDSLNPDSGAEYLDLSMSGDYVAFVGTPMLDSFGNAIADKQEQHRNDHEVWVTRRDGTTEPVQLTGRQGWKSTSLRAISIPPVKAATQAAALR